MTQQACSSGPIFRAATAGLQTEAHQRLSAGAHGGGDPELLALVREHLGVEGDVLALQQLLAEARAGVHPRGGVLEGEKVPEVGPDEGREVADAQQLARALVRVSDPPRLVACTLGFVGVNCWGRYLENRWNNSDSSYALRRGGQAAPLSAV